MESHCFSEAIPLDKSIANTDLDTITAKSAYCAASESFAPQLLPSWTVQVIRIQGQVVVGTLTIDSHSLPPRMHPRKPKKVLWQLPDSHDVVPRFGDHEKRRLWELYKALKKDKRQKLKMQSNSVVENDEHTTDELDLTSVATESSVTPTASHKSSVSSSTTKQVPINGHSKESSSDAGRLPLISSTNVSSWSANNPTTNSAAAPTLPPPGFASNVTHSHQQEQPAQPSSSSLLARHDDDVSAGELVHCSDQYFIVPYDSISSSSIDSASVDHMTTLGTAVVQAFCETVSLSPSPPNNSSARGEQQQSPKSPLDTWMSYYTPLACKSLLLNSAQATTGSTQGIRQQWQSLLLHNTSSRAAHSQNSHGDDSANGGSSSSSSNTNAWQCHGWTVQAVPTVPFMTTTTTTNNGSPGTLPAAVLVVISGQTWQTGTWLSYTLTLLLHRLSVSSTPTQTACVSSTHNATTGNTSSVRTCMVSYGIVNDIMALQPLESATTAVD